MMNWRKTNLVLSCLLALVMVSALMPQAWADEERDKERPASSAKIEQQLLGKILANPSGRFDVIVSMQPGRAGRAKQAIETAGAKVGRDLPIIGGASAVMSGRSLLALARNPNVFGVSEDRHVTILGSPVTTVSTLAVNAPEAWSLGYTGKGIGVAVLDSGVASHPDLTQPTNRIVASVDLMGGGAGAGDLGGHGTHVAGIVAGNGYSSGGARQGIAPEANVISVKVTDDSGAGSYSSVIQGIQWVMQNRRAYNIRIINISLGGPVVRSYRDDLLDTALEMAWFSGIVVTVAAGNDGPKSGTITSPGNDPYAITVGALDDNATAARQDDVVADFSSRGPTAIDKMNKPDLIAPGRRVISLRDPGSLLEKMFPDRVTDNSYFRLSGTSMAAPVVAGVAALLLQKNPELTPNQVKYVLTHAATATRYDRNTAGAGVVDALASVRFQGKGIENRGLRPTDGFARLIYGLAKGAPLVWRDARYKGKNWSNYTWGNLPWNNYTWENYSWESIDWTSPNWSNYTWENFTWENYSWENFTWENYSWENYSWENFTWETRETDD